MDDKLLKINKVVTMVWRGLIYAALIILLVSGILGYVFSYSDMMKFFKQNVNAIPTLINSIVIMNLVFIGSVAFFVFSINGKKLNFKNVITIIIEVPLLLFAIGGYILTSEYLTNVYDVSLDLFSLLFYMAIFLGGMKLMLLLISDYKLVKKETTETEN